MILDISKLLRKNAKNSNASQVYTGKGIIETVFITGNARIIILADIGAVIVGCGAAVKVIVEYSFSIGAFLVSPFSFILLQAYTDVIHKQGNQTVASDDIKQAWEAPKLTLRRLPWHLAFVKLMKGKGEVFISSTQIAKEISVGPSQVAKNLSFMNISGKTRVGHDINTLVDVLEGFLGFTSQHRVSLFGVGSLGVSLLHGTGLSQYGLEIMADSDVHEDLDGSMVSDIPVFRVDDFPAKQEEHGATIGVVIVPMEETQGTTDRIIERGIKALWDFTPFRMRVPEHIVVQNTSMCAHLAVMFSQLSSMNH